MDLKAGLDVVAKRKYLLSPGIELRLSRPSAVTLLIEVSQFIFFFFATLFRRWPFRISPHPAHE
jgi:hypothetical protein